MNRSFLIVKFSSFGDIVNSLPAIEHLKQCHPGSQINWVVKHNYVELLEGCDFVDNIIPYQNSGLKGIIEVVRKIRALKVDTVIDLQGILRSALIGYLSGAPVRVCFPHTREGSRLFYTHIMGERRDATHAVVENLSVVEALTGRKLKGRPAFSIPVREAEIERARVLLNGVARNTRALVVVSPTSRWKSKMWDGAKFALLCDMIIEEYGATVVFTGLREDAPYIEHIQRRMTHRAINLAGKTGIPELKGLLKQADLVVSCDSGTMHLASALDKAVVAIFGPTDPDYTGPFTEKRFVVKKTAECSPCRRRECGDMRCMNLIEPEDVMEGVRRLL